MKKLFAGTILIALIMVFFTTLVFATNQPGDVQKTKLLNKTYRMQIPFIENKGQIEDGSISFYAKTFGGTVFVGEDGSLTYSLPFEDRRGVVIKEVFTDKKLKVKGLEPSPTRINYFKGSDQSKWKTDIPSYNSISLGEVYKGVELKLKAYGKNVEKLFKVLPGKDPGEIKVKLGGAKRLQVNERGELEIITDHGPVTFTKPVAYQEINGKRLEVDVSYNIGESEVRSQKSEVINLLPATHSSSLHHSNTPSLSEFSEAPQSPFQNPKSIFPSAPCPLPFAVSYGFKVGDFNKSFPLIIDPLLASTYLGTIGDVDGGQSLLLDTSGNVYVTGQTSSGFPTTPGAYSETNNGSSDAFISKLDSTLSFLLASTYIGGGSSDIGYALTFDSLENVYVTGFTMSSDFPTTPGAYDENFAGTGDVFVSKLDNDLSDLLASTYLGGANYEKGYALTLDGSGNVYVTGETLAGFPTTSGAYSQIYNGGDHDVFVSKLNNDLSVLLASTYIGGDGEDIGESLVLDGMENVYVTGRAGSYFPTTAGAYDISYNGNLDVFVSKLDRDLSSLVASTYIGGGGFNDIGQSIALDGSGNVYVAGFADASYPTTPGAYDRTYNGSTYDAFVSKLDNSLSTLLASTFIGGGNMDWVRCMTLDESGNVYVSGNTNSGDFPTTPGAYDNDLGPPSDVFISRFNSNLSSLLTSTYIGGPDQDNSFSIVHDGSENVYITGMGRSGYPTTAGAYDEIHNGGTNDVFVSMLDMSLLAEVTFRAAVNPGGFAGSSQFLDDISYLDDPFAIVQCQNYTITIDFWLTDWQGANVKAIDYYFTWDTDILTVESVISENPQWPFHSEPDPVDDIYHLFLESITGIPGPDIKLHTVVLSFDTVPATGWVRAELLPDGSITDANDDEHQSVGKTEITLKTICDVNATTTCDEENPCDVLDSDDICTQDAVVSQDNYSWQRVDTQNPLCEGDLITVYHTKTGTHLVEESCTENICTSKCFNSCLTACREIEINECNVHCIGNCINGVCSPWNEENCYNYSRIVACNEECLEDCTNDCEGGNAFYNRHCGFYMDEVITMRVPDGTGGCTGEVRRQRTLSGAGNSWMTMPVPLDAGSYDMCSYDISIGTTAFIGTVVVDDCGGAACSLSIPNNLLLNEGEDGGMEVTLQVNGDAGDTYSITMDRFLDDDHQTSIGYPSFLERNPTGVTVSAHGSEPVNITATNPAPAPDGQIHWANIIIKAESTSCSCEGAFDVTVFSDEDGDGIPLGEDNCPSTSNPDQLDTYPPLGNGIGDACDCEGNFDCDQDCDGSDASQFKDDFGRSTYQNPCVSEMPCNGDFDCDQDCDGSDASQFKNDFGRSTYRNPCPVCEVREWCTY